MKKIQICNIKKNISKTVLKSLLDEGYVIISGADYNFTHIEKIKKEFISICESVGTLINHNKEGRIIWDIKENTELESSFPTYSEHSSEAILHTDSQYRDDPEDFMALYTLKTAECGGGESSLISRKDILEEIKLLENSQDILDSLQNEKYPFLVPSVFLEGDSDKAEYVYEAILEKDRIRFRVDTLEAALLTHKDTISKKAIDAFNAVKEIITNSSKIKRFHLLEGDILFINNKTMLHGRTSFEDKSRHLLRIRMKREIYE